VRHPDDRERLVPAGERTPDGMQRLSATAERDPDLVHDDLRAYVVEHLCDSGAVLVRIRPALATAWSLSKASTRALGLWKDDTGRVPTEAEIRLASQPPFP